MVIMGYRGCIFPIFGCSLYLLKSPATTHISLFKYKCSSDWDIGLGSERWATARVLRTCAEGALWCSGGRHSSGHVSWEGGPHKGLGTETRVGNDFTNDEWSSFHLRQTVLITSWANFTACKTKWKVKVKTN